MANHSGASRRCRPSEARNAALEAANAPHRGRSGTTRSAPSISAGEIFTCAVATTATQNQKMRPRKSAKSASQSPSCSNVHGLPEARSIVSAEPKAKMK